MAIWAVRFDDTGETGWFAFNEAGQLFYDINGVPVEDPGDYTCLHLDPAGVPASVVEPVPIVEDPEV